MPRSCRLAARVLVSSNATRDDLLELISLDPERISVVHPGVDSDIVRVEDVAFL